MVYFSRYESPLGGLTLAGDGEALTGLWFDGQKGFAGAAAYGFAAKRLPVFDEAAEWLDIYFGGNPPGFTPKLSLKATPFREAVWKLLLTVPYGRTLTYGDIARQLAARTEAGKISARAVGGAVSHNPISVIGPCHRIVGANGDLTGYAGGLDRKIRLLQLEGALTARP